MSRKRRPAPKKPSRPPTKSKSGPPDQSGRVITQVLHEERRISGPLPTPDILLGYDDVLPGAAERIMRMAEKEQAMVERDRASAREVEGIAVRAATADNRRGQTFGFLVALAAFGTASYGARDRCRNRRRRDGGGAGDGLRHGPAPSRPLIPVVRTGGGFAMHRRHRRDRPSLSGPTPRSSGLIRQLETRCP